MILFLTKSKNCSKACLQVGKNFSFASILCLTGHKHYARRDNLNALRF